MDKLRVVTADLELQLNNFFLLLEKVKQGDAEAASILSQYIRRPANEVPCLKLRVSPALEFALYKLSLQADR